MTSKDIWKDTRDCTPLTTEMKKRVVFVENSTGDIQSTKVNPSEWAACGFSRWVFADDFYHAGR